MTGERLRTSNEEAAWQAQARRAAEERAEQEAEARRAAEQRNREVMAENERLRTQLQKLEEGNA